MKRFTVLVVALSLTIAMLASACGFANDPNSELVATVPGRISDAEVQAICVDHGYSSGGFGRYVRNGNAGQVTMVYCYLMFNGTFPTG